MEKQLIWYLILICVHMHEVKNDEKLFLKPQIDTHD